MRIQQRSVMCAALLATLAIYCHGQTLAPPRPFSITIGLEQSAFKVGSEIRLKVALTNTSDHDILIGRAKGDAQGEVAGFNIELQGEKGENPHETKYQRIIRGEEEGSLVWSPIGITLAPGKSCEDAMIVNRFFDLDKPGKYKIQVQRTDPGSKAIVKSNTVTLTLVP